MSEKVIVVDGNNLCHRAYYKFARLTSKGGLKTSLIFGVPKILKPIISKHKPTKVIVVFDGKKRPERMKLLPGYKEGRKKSLDFDAEDFYNQRDVLKDMLPHFGIDIVHMAKHEADDLIFILARKYSRKRSTVIILSNDKDFHQLVRTHVWIESPRHEATLKPHNFSNYVTEYTPKTCVDYLSLDGDSSDKIPGVRGFGAVTLGAFFENFDTVKDYLESDDDFKKFDKKELAATVARNKRLIDLRLFNKEYLKGMKTVKTYKVGNFDKREIALYMHKYNIKTFADKNFKEAFKNIGQ